MFNPLKALGNINQLQQQAKQMQQSLQQETVTVENNHIKVVMRGDQQVIEVYIDGILDNRIAETINEAIKKTQELAAKKFLEMSQNQE